MKTTEESKTFFELPSTNELYKADMKYTAIFQGWSLKKLEKHGMYVFKLDYTSDIYNSSCLLPLSHPLPEIKFMPHSTQPKKSWVQKIAKVLGSPVIASIPIAASFLNIFAIITGMYAFAPLSYATIGLFALQSTGLLLSVGGITTAIVAYGIVPFLNRRLATKFDLLEEEIKKPVVFSYEDYSLIKVKKSIFRSLYEYLTIAKEFKSDYFQVQKIPLIYRVLVHPDFPGNQELKWRYHYLDSLSRSRRKSGFHPSWNPFITALTYCSSDTQRFICLRNIFNSTEMWCRDLKTYSYDELITPYMSEISSENSLHQALRKQLKLQLNDCVLDLITGNSAIAFERFNKIEFDAYSQKAYPDLGVLYYQLDGILTIIEKKMVYESRHSFDDNIRLHRTLKKLEKINTPQL